MRAVLYAIGLGSAGFLVWRLLAAWSRRYVRRQRDAMEREP